MILDLVARLVSLDHAVRAIGTTEERDWPVTVAHHTRPIGEPLCADNLCARCVTLRLTWRLPAPYRVARRTKYRRL